MSFKACIFDLDGTLCDSVESIACSANHALRDFGMKEATIEEYKVFVGDGVDTLIRRLLRFGGDEACEGFEKVRDRYMEYFKEGCLYNVKPYPGIVATLKELKKQGAKIAVLSNKPDDMTKRVVDTLYGEIPFAVRRGQRDGFPKKPAPDGLWAILEELDCPKEDCLYIGDSDVDIQTGRNSGVATVGVTWGFRTPEELRAAGCTTLIDRPEQLLNLIGE